MARKKLEAKGKAFLKSFVKLEQAPIQRGDKISSSNWYGIHKMDGKKVGELSGFRKFISISKKRKIRK